VLNFPGHKRNANQNYIKISSYSIGLELFSLKTKTTTNVGKDAVKQEPICTVDGNVH
jgi:hypothetical protein